ncbi:DNA repair protein RAD4 [Impatiens glandulifera]|uniref:DNA repair protein RAD4 n=1 Tax=Impatiens glandulifera TaxID=253017 RepID=UPI001FB1359A|nr:DNA repair protein RAD4 [Impatiens glandulifera]
MRTRKQAERENQTNGSLTAISHDSVGKILKRAKTNPRKKDQGWEDVDKMKKSSDAGERNTEKPDIQMKENSLQQEPCSDALPNMEGGSFQSNPPVGEEMDVQWEEGSTSTFLSAKNHSESLVAAVTNEKSCKTSNSPDMHSESMAKCMTIEFDATTKSTPKKTIRRASTEEKEIAELVHKVHLLCLLGRGRLIDAACNDPLIQASLLSILPSQLSEISRIEKLTVKALVPVVHWFHNNFHARGTTDSKRSFSSALVHALETREGTSEEVAALSVALFRALNLTTRFVTILDISPVKPETTKSESTDEHASARKGIFGAATLMVSRLDQASASSVKQFSLDDRTNASEAFSKDTCGSKNNKRLCNSNKFKEPCVVNQQKLASNAACEGCDDELPVKKSGDPKRKGDLEYQMQLEMALSATAVGGLDCSSNPSGNSAALVKRIRTDENEDSTRLSQGISTAIGSRKVGAPLHWAEVYCPGENMTGKWVHIDVVNAIIDGEEKVEAAAAACKTSLRYVVAFAGSGAKDITRRYCMKWYKIAPQRVDSDWWNAVLAPLKELESRATGGESVRHEKESALNRNALEDMELETRALTEPLPSNQQAYKNHPLYALERWLTKYQILHPKGPVLGFCSGQPVYPRATVQILHTKNRWLCEGLQLKANELPAKVLKCSRRLNKPPQAFEGGDHEEETSKREVMLYGKWQTEPLILPHAVNGIVPKNERGQVDVWSEKCLPPGTVHLRLRFVHLVAKRFEIDYAPAMVGFEFRNGRSFPVFEGIVVCAEFKEVILEAYAEQEERRMLEEKKRNEAQAASRWYQLLSSIITRQKLNNRYGNNNNNNTTSTHISAKKPEVFDDGGCKDKQIRQMESNTGDLLAKMGEEHEHEHAFVLDEELDDETSWMRTKRCYCGFSIQVEEL